MSVGRVFGLILSGYVLSCAAPRAQPEAAPSEGGAKKPSGRLPPEVVQSVVRQHFKAFRPCYEAGLARDPNLRGKVSTRFVIGVDGAVTNVSDGGSDLPDEGVRACVQREFYGMKFPAPEGGIVTVIYPIMLDSR